MKKNKKFDAPLYEAVRQHAAAGRASFHTPGHKGSCGFLPLDPVFDLTELPDTDSLYESDGCIREAEVKAARLFGADVTAISSGGCTLAIQGMLAAFAGAGSKVIFCRNIHRSAVNASALLDFDPVWVMHRRDAGKGLPGRIDAEDIRKAVQENPDAAAVYVTSPDYYGCLSDIKAIAAVCRQHNIPLLVDNAHGTHLIAFGKHPITLGASASACSAHKTLPVLTGGAWLNCADGRISPGIKSSMALFGSTSPSYLILQSLDACNAYLDSGYRGHLATLIHQLNSLKTQLTAHGYSLIGDESIKLTLAPKSYGYTGDELHDLLRVHNMECEFSDPDFLTLMFTPDTTDEALHHLQSVLLDVPRKAAISVQTPPLPHPERVLSIRDAMLSPGVEITVEEAEGRIFADAHVGCPPCIPIIAAGERIDQNAVRCFQYYGIKTCRVIP